MTGVGLHGGFRGNEWYAHRVEVFKNYTLKSLIPNKDKIFLWMWLRKEEENNPITGKLIEILKTFEVPFLLTFNGLLYWDDKFNNYGLRAITRNALMMAKDRVVHKDYKRPFDILKNAWENKNKTLVQRVKLSLDKLKEKIGSQYDWIYLTRLDSDDMLSKDIIPFIQAQPPAYKKSITLKNGYIHNTNTRQLAEWNPPTNPPFHTIIFPGSTFFNPQSHVEYYGSFTSHEDIPKVFNAEEIGQRDYCVTVHGNHISTNWEPSAAQKVRNIQKYGKADVFKGKELFGEDKDNILKIFSI